MQSSKFLGLGLLVAKIVKKLGSADILGFDCLVKKWASLDTANGFVLKDIVYNGRKSENEASIREAVKKCMEKFCLNKGSIIRSVLDRPFQKVVLDHLVVNDELILELNEMRLNVNNYVRDSTFSGVMDVISMDKLFLVIGNLPDGKAIGLFGIPNKLWKHGGKKVLKCLLVLLNTCLSVGMVPAFKFGILQNDNFLVLCGMFTQSLVFIVGSVVEDAFKKNREIWLHIKMCERFIKFFGNIHEDRINRVMTDFGLSNGYRVYDNLDQDEVKRHEQLCKYHINSKFVAKMGRVESVGGMTSYFAAGIFYALNIASEFFKINNISINNDKTVAILINQGVKIASLNICGQPISIAKKGKAHHYLEIFLFMEGLSKPSVAKAHSDICFFVNVVLRKAITDKQYSYLVSAILQPIISYQTQFSYNVMIKKGLKSKAGLFHDFPDAALYHPSLYGLKTFEQMQSEGKIAALVFFSNFPVKLHVSSVDNFLARIVKIFLNNELSLVNNLPNAFCSPGFFLISSILGNSLYFNSDQSLRRFGVAFSDHFLSKKDGVLDWKIFHCWKRLNPRGLIPYWFLIASEFLLSNMFSVVKDGLHDVWSDCFKVYTDGSLKEAGSANVTCGTAVYFPALNLSIGIAIHGLLSSTLAELQAVALSFECVLSSCKLILHINSQTAINSCLLELSSADKDLEVVWVKIKGHSDISGNIKADLAAEEATWSSFTLLAGIREWFLVAENTVVSGNAHYFIRDIFQSVSHAYWETGPGYGVVPDELVGGVDWISIAKVWHFDSYMFAGFISQSSLNLCIYLMKTVHKYLPVVVRKRLYNKKYPDVMYLLCGKVKFLDHVFTCVQDVAIHNEVLAKTSVH
ncbi:hypothetical protein G9A89_005963 [Geosiphon pyriformis]|nr:hypothetical protein G9A89_005963 [Geosiphon pyriformis]